MRAAAAALELALGNYAASNAAAALPSIASKPLVAAERIAELAGSS